MCIDKVHEESKFMAGNSPAIVSIDRAGAFILDVSFHRRIQQEKKMINGELYIFRSVPTTFLHQHGINRLEVETIELCEELGYELKWWRLDKDNIYKFKYIEEYTLIPDILLGIYFNGKSFLAYIEYDTGYENYRSRNSFPVILDKLKKYQAYKASMAWISEGWYGKLATTFPILLFVTEDSHRIEFVNTTSLKLGLKVVAMLTEDYKTNLKGLLS